VYERVLLRLFDHFSTKEDLADMFLQRESMMKLTDNDLATMAQLPVIRNINEQEMMLLKVSNETELKEEKESKNV